jgi:hypothetical protein
MPVTIPDVPIAAIPVLPLFHVPPASASEREVVKPAQTVTDPDITAGNGFIVIDATPNIAALQPVTE